MSSETRGLQGKAEQKPKAQQPLPGDGRSWGLTPRLEVSKRLGMSPACLGLRTKSLGDVQGRVEGIQGTA